MSEIESKLRDLLGALEKERAKKTEGEKKLSEKEAKAIVC